MYVQHYIYIHLYIYIIILFVLFLFICVVPTPSSTFSTKLPVQAISRNSQYPEDGKPVIYNYSSWYPAKYIFLAEKALHNYWVLTDCC